MPSTTQTERARELLRQFPRSWAEEAGIDLRKGTPAALFQWLVFSLLASARIRKEIARDAARALFAAGWKTPEKMRASTWRQRTDTLNAAGYARYDESTSRYLADAVEHVLAEYGGDLRELRRHSDGDLEEMRRRLTAFKGIGNTGADIFLRGVQLTWDEVYPFVDARTATAAQKQGLNPSPAQLRRRVNNRE